MTIETGAAVGERAHDTDFFGHPRGLRVLFMTEMWERFSYYGMRALLIFYLTQHFLFRDNPAFAIYGAYTALVYLTPVIGGLLADRYLGSRKAVTFGAILLVLGQFGMAIQGDKSEQVIALENAEYQLLTEGRGKKAESFLVVAGERHAFKYESNQWIIFEGTTANLPARIDRQRIPTAGGEPETVYKFKSEPYGFLWLNKRYSLIYNGQEFAVEYDEGNSQAGQIIDGETRVGFKIEEENFLTFTDSVPAALPRQIPDATYELRTKRDPFYLNLFYLSLALIITGVGFLKANISTIVGALYEKDDPRRDRGFTMFYMGINTGALLAPLIAGTIGQLYGWVYGFGFAGFGMLFGLIQFQRGQKYLYGHADPPDEGVLKEKLFAGLSRETVIYIGGFAGVALIWQLIQRQELVGGLFDGFGLLVLSAILIFSFWKCHGADRGRMIVATVLIMTSILFWALFEQAGSSLNLLADRNVDRFIFGWEIPSTWFQSANPFFIVVLAPIVSMLWTSLGKRGREPSTPVKFGLGLTLLGLGYIVLVFGMVQAGGGYTPLIWLVFIYFLHTVGELCLSPIGLSMITKLSVARVVGMMMGAWFLASGYANLLAGQLAQMTSVEGHGGEVADAATAAATYIDVYMKFGLMAVASGVVMILISPILRKHMHGVH